MKLDPMYVSDIDAFNSDVAIKRTAGTVGGRRRSSRNFVGQPTAESDASLYEWLYPEDAGNAAAVAKQAEDYRRALPEPEMLEGRPSSGRRTLSLVLLDEAHASSWNDGATRFFRRPSFSRE